MIISCSAFKQTLNDHCWLYKQELRFLCSACCLMMLYITMFHDNILNGIQVMERTQNYNSLISKGNNTKNVQTRVMVLVVCTSSDDALYFYEISWKYLEQTLLCDGWMDRQMDRQPWQNQCLHPCQGQTFYRLHTNVFNHNYNYFVISWLQITITITCFPNVINYNYIAM